MSDGKRNWYVVYTKPRWEKKVYQLIVNTGMEAYCPLNRVRKKWSDRIKWVEEPLFKSYLFVSILEEQQTDVRMIDGVLNFVYWLGKPAVVKEKEIQTIRKFLKDYHDVQALPVDLSANDAVTISQGALMDRKARVLKVFNNKVQVVIESIGYSLVAFIDKSNLSLADK